MDCLGWGSIKTGWNWDRREKPLLLSIVTPNPPLLSFLHLSSRFDVLNLELNHRSRLIFRRRGLTPQRSSRWTFRPLVADNCGKFISSKPFRDVQSPSYTVQEDVPNQYQGSRKELYLWTRGRSSRWIQRRHQSLAKSSKGRCGRCGSCWSDKLYSSVRHDFYNLSYSTAKHKFH